ncbi:GntR family transcriptional regulator [Granulicella tundricola]|uniref:Transcriptional regulator, GntR family n=1 Tax=Granulicella tundricola (strain ATCC BAA-1859 / DSM 23138 / MP5ACTX9) TaxID=1198114 RepID=E8X6E7_GRATM|nr:GntR family transcriptional regulator [Granulicella tundricola]ADW71031.1 transcriptional regulator, GntR family [Granulicella tundricola MP5ACTX9]
MKTTKTGTPPTVRAKAEHGTSLLTAFREIRELIVHGRLSPGTWILEAELAERLNMSRTPVRGAIHWLQREGYILEHRNVKKSRMIVAPLTKEDANELYMIIGRIEGIAGRGVAVLPLAERKAICSQLKKLNERLELIAKGRDGHPGDIFELDRDFHRLVIKHGAGARLTTLHTAIEPQTERYWRLYASSIIKDLHLSVGEHDAIIQSILAGDADRVEAGLQQNWLKGSERLGHVIEIFGERGSW